MFKLSLCLLATGCVVVLTAAPASIGIASSTGQFRVNGSSVPGNGNLFVGDIVETASARSVVRIGAADFTLLPESRAHIFQDRTVLEKGSGLLAGTQSRAVEAASLRVLPSGPNSVIQVEITAPNHVSVAARDGAAEVRNSSGTLVASLRAGMALAFDTQAGASSTLKITGKMVTKDGKFYLTDDTSCVKFELLGKDLATFIDKVVTVTGSAIPSNTTSTTSTIQVVQVITIEESKHKGGACVVGAPLGMSALKKAAIIGGIGVAGTVVGLAAAGTFSGATISAP
jgi:hypothetical protein